MSYELLKKCYDYDPKTGLLIWRWREDRLIQWNCQRAWKRAGSLNRDGYRYVFFEGRNYKEHRLIWWWMTGDLPVHDIDHKNRIKDDNKWENLRLATSEGLTDDEANGQNRLKNTNNKTGYTGVVFHKRDKRYQAQIKIKGKTEFLGNYDTAKDAHQAYIEAKRKYHEFQPDLRQ